MRILHVGTFVDGPNVHPDLATLTPHTGLRAALRQHGDVRSIAWPQVLHSVGREALQWLVRGASCGRWVPHWTFLQVQGDQLDDDTVAAITGKVFSWSGDVREPLQEHYIRRAAVVDVTSFSNLEDVESIRAHECSAEFLQVGYDDQTYWRAPQEGRFGIVFLGHHYGSKFPRSAERLEMVTALRARFGKRFRLYGGGWPNELGALPAVSGDAEAGVLRRAKVAVCQNHFVRGRYTSDRTFRSMGCGALVLQSEFPGRLTELGVGTHDYWDSADELCDKVDTWCADDAKRAEIANAGAHYARQHCTWQARMREWAAIMNGE